MKIDIPIAFLVEELESTVKTLVRAKALNEKKKFIDFLENKKAQFETAIITLNL